MAFDTASDPCIRKVWLPANELLVTWAAPDPASADQSGTAIFRRRFDGQGAPIDPAPILTNTTFGDDQHGPSIALLDGGATVIAWRTQQTDEIRFRVLAADGTLLSDDVVVATGRRPSLGMMAAIPSVGFVVIWGVTGCPGGPGQAAETSYQLFGPDGAALGPPEQANATLEGTQADERGRGAAGQGEPAQEAPGAEARRPARPARHQLGVGLLPAGGHRDLPRPRAPGAPAHPQRPGALPPLHGARPLQAPARQVEGPAPPLDRALLEGP